MMQYSDLGCSQHCSDLQVLAVCLTMSSWQEDAHAVDLNLDDQHTALFGVFDGHAGKEVAAFCARHVVSGSQVVNSIDANSKYLLGW